jgi:hypothetical protein
MKEEDPTLSGNDKICRIKIIEQQLKLKTGVETAGELYAKYKFPTELLRDQINKLGKLLKDVNELPSANFVQPEITKRTTSIASPENGAELRKMQDEKKMKELALEAAQNLRLTLF